MDASHLSVPERSTVSLIERTAARKRAQNGPAQTARKIRLVLDEVRRRYRYRRLDTSHTRLLVIHPPRSGPDELYVELIPVAFTDLGAKVKYEALSYHWGGESDLRPIYVRTEADDNAKVHDEWEESPASAKHRSLQMIAKDVLLKKLHVKANLYSALRHLRLNTRPVLLWVDALCIDQSDSQELGLQVARMVEIYSSASRVVTWLGDDDPRSRSAVEFIQDVTDADDIDEILTNPSSVKRWADLAYLMQNPWFSRRWVIQEMVHAQKATIQLSELAISWSRFRDAVSLFVLNADKIRGLLNPMLELSTGLGNGVLLHNNLGRLDFLLQNNLDGLPAKVFIDVLDYMFRKPKSLQIGSRSVPVHGLEFLVSTLYIYENSDPRDTIFALRNIASEVCLARSTDSNGHPPPEPDYTKTVLEVYADFVKWVVDTTGTIDILCRPWAPAERKQGGRKHRTISRLPSWIRIAKQEDKSRRGMESTSFAGLPGRNPYNASYGLRCKTTFSEHVLAIFTVGAPRLDPNEWTWEEQDNLNISSPPNLADSVASADDSHPKPKRSREADVEETMELSAEQHASKRIKPTQDSAIVQPASDASFSLPSVKAYQLSVEGISIGMLTWATDPIEDGVIPSEALQRLQATPRTTPRITPGKLWRTLVGERGPDGRNPPTWYERAARYCMIHKTPNGHLNTENLLSQPQPAIVKSFLQRVQAVSWDRCIVEVAGDDLEEPLYGFAPAATRTGDRVCVLFGCSVPCVLRPLDTPLDGVHYKFIGEACVYGLMDGEAISVLSAEQLKKKTSIFQLL
ncbi:Hypothetical predicted protein [Lecanosticta acicola]|uniref:Heterokaryon incompatibility domain-containing protein n=1 Tax=Lecanosticta acicola TaxID=111012 RepID=A0AAI8W1H6_9PEZI|nr:Hypothetical predicted protein [Lecanosticta acicola]